MSFETMQAFPNATALRSATPPALGMVMLRSLKRLHGRSVTARSLVDDAVDGVDVTNEGKRVAAEAMQWLFNHGFVAKLEESVGWRIFITRLGEQILESAGSTVGGIAIALRAVDLIPEQLRAKVTQPLLAGDFDLAITAACKAVEVRMRERARLPTSDFGSRLAKKFFAKATSTELQHPERRGDLADEVHLFEGLFGLYRDRAVHDVPHVDDPVVATEIIVSAAHLLRIVESAELP